jgi:hypothetical protein
MSNNSFLLSTVLALATPAMAQSFLTTSTNALRHGDILCRVEIPYESEGERGEASVWTLPAIPDDSPDYLQAIRSNGDTTVIYERNRMLHYLMRGDTLYNKGEQSRRAYRILSQERPELVYPFQYGDSISGSYEGNCQYEGIRYTVSGSGYTVADGMGILTDGEDTLRHVLRLHLHDYFEDDYGNETMERWSSDCFRWYCMGYRYPVMETVITCRHDEAEQEQTSSVTYLYLPVMQMELEEDVANEALLAQLEAGGYGGQEGGQGGPGSLESVEATLSSDGQSLTIHYSLGSNSDITFYACDIMGNMLGSSHYQNREAGEWQECLTLSRRPIGNALMLSIHCGEQWVSMKVCQ